MTPNTPPADQSPEACLGYTKEQFSKAFSEWERDFREHPEDYMTPEQKAGESPQSYGDLCAGFFMKMLLKVCNQ